jgi:formylglycine-generating enzyme required for sulfatase activity
MRKLFLIILVFMSTSFTSKNGLNFDINSFKKDFSKVRSDLFVGKYEVSNVAYRRFLTDLMRSTGDESYIGYLPDTLCWKKQFRESGNHQPLVEYYFRNPSYDLYPVVGVSYESAIKYCAWLTENYNRNSRRKFEKVYFKLLTRDEWTFAANKGDSSKVYPWGSGFIQNNRKQDLCNYRHVEYRYDSATKRFQEIAETSSQESAERNKITVSVASYFPNSFGLYNMSGNVAEMIAERGIAKGGSYRDPAYRVRISSEEEFSAPQADIGFRVAMKVLVE